MVKSFLERWKEDGLSAAFGGAEQEPSKEGTSKGVTQPVVSTVPVSFVQPALVAPNANSLTDSTKQAFVDEVARQVPHLKKLLDAAAVIVDDVPDFQKRLSITAKQLRASGQFDAQQALTGLKQSVAGMVQTLRAEVSEEEARNVATPLQQFAQLEEQRQALIRQAQELEMQMGTLKLQVATAQDALAKSRGKCDAGIQFMETWQTQMEQLLNGLK